MPPSLLDGSFQEPLPATEQAGNEVKFQTLRRMIRSFLILTGRSPCFDSPQGLKHSLALERQLAASLASLVILLAALCRSCFCDQPVTKRFFAHTSHQPVVAL
ncbi:hypothetical protein AK812_SmicGene37897 [Symbiodinium microadriaticum]|uniref:Uncharacterized protein n=1 Tax=Symbiodinium microadriaticum TaxID=2951 RepID=A0A1Q9CF59_SYMMI|nr:hypothetical protein AK812_SmicGene37897 [Symbiodinium microadriaticum]